MVVIACLSYGFLYLFNYLVTESVLGDVIQLSSYNIDIQLVLNASIFLSILLVLIPLPFLLYWALMNLIDIELQTGRILAILNKTKG
jgi:hypothetical protein